MKNTISLFQNKPNYIKKVSDDPIINITGLVGSGKTTLANTYRESDRYLIVSLDTLFGSTRNSTTYSIELRKMLEAKYGSLDLDHFEEYYFMIISYFLEHHPDYHLVLEGPQIHQNLMPLNLKGTIIVVRTSGWTSFRRAVKRDIEYQKHRLEMKEITKKQYQKEKKYVKKKRFHQMHDRKRINLFIKKLQAL